MDDRRILGRKREFWATHHATGRLVRGMHVGKDPAWPAENLIKVVDDQTNYVSFVWESVFWVEYIREESPKS
jgi:hypothetical protein